MKAKEVYKVTTSNPNGVYPRSFWVTATSPGRAISKMKRRGRGLLDRGEKITGATLVGTIDME